MEISIKVRNVLCALVRLSREGYTMKEYMFTQSTSLSGMYEKMVDGLQFPQTSHLQHVKDDFRDYITGVYKEVDKTSDLSKLYDLVCECWKDEEKFEIMFEQFPGESLGAFVFDYPKGETLSHPEKRTLDGLIAHAVRSVTTNSVKGVVDLIMGYLATSHDQETDLKMIGILDPTALMKFPMTSSDRQIRKVVIKAVEEYFSAEEVKEVEQEQDVETQERKVVITEDVVDFIIGQINLKPGFEPDPELEQYLGDEQRMLELIQTHADPKIWGKFFSPYDVLETLHNRYMADTDRDAYIATQINQPNGRKEVRFGLFLLHDEDRVLDVITEHKSAMTWGAATPEEILNYFKTKYDMKIDKKEEVMNAQRINLHGLTIEEAMAAIQKAVPELADRLFIKETPVSETAVNDLYLQVVRLEEESNNKVIPQDTKQLMENVYATMQKVSYIDLLKELGGRLSNPNIHPKPAQRFGYIAGLISAAYHTLANKEKETVQAGEKSITVQELVEQVCKSIITTSKSSDEALTLIRNLMDSYGIKAVYKAVVGTEPTNQQSKHQMSAVISMNITSRFPVMVNLNDNPGNTIPGMNASPDELNRLAHKLTMACANYCCSNHFGQTIRAIHAEHGAELMRTVIGMYHIGTNLQHHGSAESYVNDWAQKFISDRRNNQPGQFNGGIYNRYAPTGEQFQIKPTMRVYSSVEEMVRDIGHPGCASL